jgi:ribosomal protein L7/L12
MNAPKGLPSAVMQALERGEIMTAVKLLRNSGISLKEAKDAIDAHTSSRPAAASPSSFTARTAGVPLPPEVLSALEQGNKIDAIRLMREKTGLGLKEAKEAVDGYDHTNAKAGGLSPGEVPATSAGMWWIAALVVIALIGYFLLRRAA